MTLLVLGEPCSRCGRGICAQIFSSIALAHHSPAHQGLYGWPLMVVLISVQIQRSQRFFG